MVATLVATPEPNNTPPRVRLDLDTGNSSLAFDSIEIRRNGVLIRSVAPTSSQLSVLYDYDCPFGTPVEYSAEGSISGVNVLRTETWPNLIGWSTVSGSPAVGSGALTSGIVTRTIAGAFPSSGKLVATVSSPLYGKIKIGPLKFESAGDINLYVLCRLYAPDMVTQVGSFYTLYNGGPFTATWGNGIVTVTTSLGSVSQAFTPAATTNPITVESLLPGFTYTQLITPAAFGPLTDSVTLDAAEAWLIHPTNPDLSVCVSTINDGNRYDRIYVEEGSAEQVTYPAQREVHAPLGRSRQVPVTYGDRRDGEWSLVLRIPRAADRSNMLSLLTDQSPILVRVPPAFPWDLADGWYSVGDLDDNRLLATSTQNLRSMTLPLIPVDEPVLAQGAQWTYGDDLIRNPTYSDSRNEFPTYVDRLVGPVG